MRTMSELLPRLQTSGLVETRHLDRVAIALDMGDSPTEALAPLVEDGTLTPWQAKALLQGRKRFHLSRYLVLEEIGRGGMGVVYRAYDPEFRREVAIKVVHPEKSCDPRAIGRFIREIHALSRCQHPGIVGVYEAGRIGKSFYLVMEYLPGRTLGWYAQRGRRLPLDWVCECIRQAAEALNHAHAMGIVHRDIKPSNLMVQAGPDGEPKVTILDFGLSLCQEAWRADELTGVSEVLGTVDYISPEQGRATHTADARSDVYSLGATLYRMLCGRPPFLGSNAVEKLLARYQDEPDAADIFRPDLPPQLASVIHTTLKRDPAERFTTAGELAEALEPFATYTTACGSLPCESSPDDTALDLAAALEPTQVSLECV